jgi:hypothetical protein
MEGLGVIEKVKIVPRTHLNFPIRPEMCYRRVNWSSATAAAAATDLGKIVIEPDLEREDGNGGGDDVFPDPQELGVVFVTVEAHSPGLFIGQRGRFRGGGIFLCHLDISPAFVYEPVLGDDSGCCAVHLRVHSSRRRGRFEVRSRQWPSRCLRCQPPMALTPCAACQRVRERRIRQVDPGVS